MHTRDPLLRTLSFILDRSRRLAMMGVSMLLMMVGTYEYLFPAIVLCGLAYGSFNALCPTLISELFGMEHFAKICESNIFHR